MWKKRKMTKPTLKNRQQNYVWIVEKWATLIDANFPEQEMWVPDSGWRTRKLAREEKKRLFVYVKVRSRIRKFVAVEE